MRVLPRLLLLMLLVPALLPWGGYRAASASATVVAASLPDAPRVEAAEAAAVIAPVTRCHGPALPGQVCADQVILTAGMQGLARQERGRLTPGGAWPGRGIVPAHVTGPPRIG